jgi:hypothetical protein
VVSYGIAERLQKLFMASSERGGWASRAASPEELARLTSPREDAYRDSTPWDGDVALAIPTPDDPRWVPPEGRTVVVWWRDARELLSGARRARMLDELCRWPV